MNEIRDSIIQIIKNYSFAEYEKLKELLKKIPNNNIVEIFSKYPKEDLKKLAIRHIKELYSRYRCFGAFHCTTIDDYNSIMKKHYLYSREYLNEHPSLRTKADCKSTSEIISNTSSEIKNCARFYIRSFTNVMYGQYKTNNDIVVIEVDLIKFLEDEVPFFFSSNKTTKTDFTITNNFEIDKIITYLFLIDPNLLCSNLLNSFEKNISNDNEHIYNEQHKEVYVASKCSTKYFKCVYVFDRYKHKLINSDLKIMDFKSDPIRFEWF